jgi:hypothetical protein
VRWDEWLLGELDDLEAQAQGLYLADRAEQVAEQSVDAYAEVTWASRLLATQRAAVRLTCAGGHVVAGDVVRVGAGWLVLEPDTLVLTAAILRAGGLPPRAVHAEVAPVRARLGLGSVLRRLAAAREDVSLGLVDGSVLSTTLRRVGSDFVELGATAEVVPWSSLAVVRRQVG